MIAQAGIFSYQMLLVTPMKEATCTQRFVCMYCTTFVRYIYFCLMFVLKTSSSVLCPCTYMGLVSLDLPSLEFSIPSLFSMSASLFLYLFSSILSRSNFFSHYLADIELMRWKLCGERARLIFVRKYDERMSFIGEYLALIRT